MNKMENKINKGDIVLHTLKNYPMDNKLDDILSDEIIERNRKRYRAVFIFYALFLVLWCVIIIVYFREYAYLMPLISPLGFVVGPWARKKYPTHAKLN